MMKSAAAGWREADLVNEHIRPGSLAPGPGFSSTFVCVVGHGIVDNGVHAAVRTEGIQYFDGVIHFCSPSVMCLL